MENNEASIRELVEHLGGAQKQRESEIKGGQQYDAAKIPSEQESYLEGVARSGHGTTNLGKAHELQRHLCIINVASIKVKKINTHICSV
jgi:hypothetical protein